MKLLSRVVIVAAAVNVGLAACMDSTGASRSESGSSQPGAPLEIAGEPTVRIGRANGTEADILNRVVTPFFLPDGRIVVPVSGDPAVRVYSAMGALEHVLGRRGEGPGEFLGIEAAWGVGDTIEVYDSRLQRITRFLDAELIDVHKVAASGRAVPGRLLGGWIFTGLVNAGPVTTDRPPGSVKRDTVAFYYVGMDGQAPKEIARLPGLSRYVTAAGRLQPEPLSPEVRFGLLGDVLLIGQTLEPLIQGFDLSGRPGSELRWTALDALGPSRAHDNVLDSARVRAASSGGRALLDYSDAPVPDRVSSFWDFLVDSEKFVWVLVYDPLKHAHALGGWRGAGPGGHWIVLDQMSHRVLEVALPPQLYPSQITRDKVMGIERDALGVESVAIYSLSRR